MQLATDPGAFTFSVGGSSDPEALRSVTVTLEGKRAEVDRRRIVPVRSSTSG